MSRALAERLTGITPVLVTPIRDDHIDTAALESEVRWLLDHGAQSLAIGLASEVSRLTTEERVALTAAVRAALPAGTPLVVACAADSTHAVVELGTSLAGAGADALMVTAPRVPGLDPEAVTSFYRTLSTEVDAALILQDAPLETGVPIADETIARIAAEVPRLVAVKLESPDALDRMSRLSGPLSEHGVLMLGGSGGADYLVELELGAGGTMPGPALVDVFIQVDALHRTGNAPGAARLMAEYASTIEVARRGMAPFIAAQKRFLRARGLDMPVDSRAPAARLAPWFDRHLDHLAASLTAPKPAPPKGH